jgi:glycosyltransferase involved in cell wall biosynthesis
MTEAPFVSIIIPVYNSENFIAETIDAALNQTYPFLEIILINDGSTDNSAKLMEPYGENPKIRIIHQANKGAAAARNTGYKDSRGAYIKFLDADDIMSADMIAEQVKLARKNPNGIISSQWGRFYHNDLSSFKLNPEECWQDMPAADWLCSSWKYTSSTTVPGIFLIPRRIVEQAGLWNESLSLLDDAEYFARTILAAEQVIFSPYSTLYYRSGLRNNLSGRKDPAAQLSAFEAYHGVISALLARRNDRTAQQLAANIWQLFIYTVYPERPDLLSRAQQALTALPAPDISFPAGGYTRFLSQLIGWKATKMFKSFLAKKG